MIKRADHDQQSVLEGLGTGDREEDTRDNIQIIFMEVEITINACLSLSSI